MAELIWLSVIAIFLANSSSAVAIPVNSLRLVKLEKVVVNYDHNVNLNVTPTIINESSSIVNVTWSGVSDPSKHDWIGVWLLPDSSSTIDPKHHAPTKYQYCKYDDSYLDTGSGKLSIQLINMRASYQLALMHGDIDDPKLIATSQKVSFSNPNEPLQGHLALTKDYINMMLTWVTKNTSSPQVQWGTTTGNYDFKKEASSSTYSASDMCDSPAKDGGWIDPGLIHSVIMDNLTPATTYYYKFGSDEGGWSDEYMFVSSPIPGPEVATRVLAYGDMGHGEVDQSLENKKYQQPSLNTTNRLLEDKGDFIMHIGDLSYAEGYGASWEEFFHQVQPLMTRYPYMVNPGNHESDSPNSDAFFQGDDSGGECNIPYIKKFPMPRQGPDKPWYSFSYGSIHVIMMSTEHDFQTTSSQYTDLVGLFEEVNRTETPWLVFSGHRPMYVSSPPSDDFDSHSTVAKLLRINIEPLLLKYQVDLALWGHDHSYQRTCPVSDGTCTDKAPVHVVIGMGGQKLTKNLNPDQPDYFQYVDNEHYGYSRFTINSTTLLFEFVRNIDGVIADSWTISR